MKIDIQSLLALSETPVLLEVGRKAIEDLLVDLRDSQIAMLRNNGLVIKERDGKNSDVIRMGPEDALRVGLKAIAEHLRPETRKIRVEGLLEEARKED